MPGIGAGPRRFRGVAGRERLPSLSFQGPQLRHRWTAKDVIPMSALACTVEPFAGRSSPTVVLPAGRPSRVDANPACPSCHGLSLWQALRRRPDPVSVTKTTTVGRATEALSPGRCRCDLSVLHGTGVTHQRPARQLRAVHAASSFSDKMAMPVCFRFGGGCREQRVRALSVQPCRHLGVGVLHHQFGHDVGVENEHGCRPWSNCGGSRTGSLGGISSSTPPNGLNSSCIAVPRFLLARHLRQVRCAGYRGPPVPWNVHSRQPAYTAASSGLHPNCGQ